MKLTINDMNNNELARIIRVCSAFISTLNMQHMTMAEAARIFEMPDHKAALRLGLTVSTHGIYHDHDLDCAPVTAFISECMMQTKASTIAAFCQLRETAKMKLPESN